LDGQKVDIRTLEAALAEYIATLSKSTRNTSRTEDRATYQRHLASAALMFVAIHQDDAARLKELIDGASHDFGWGYLSGEEGSAAEGAWVRFADFVRSALKF
jgi:hypothetical protein